jgi:hypothetical protein
LHLPYGPSQAAIDTAKDVVLQPDRPAIESTVQYSPARQKRDHTGPHFEVGHIGVEWFPDAVGAEMHGTLAEQARLIWSALKATTRPAKVEVVGGRPLGGYRIGDAALDLVTSTRLPLNDGALRFRLR